MKRISVKGYKAINNEKELDLAPINLLIGANGSGKSTFINSLVFSYASEFSCADCIAIIKK